MRSGKNWTNISDIPRQRSRFGILTLNHCICFLSSKIQDAVSLWFIFTHWKIILLNTCWRNTWYLQTMFFQDNIESVPQTFKIDDVYYTNETLLIWVKKWKMLIFFNSECYEWKFRESIKRKTNYLALPLIECIIVMKWRKLNKFTHCFLLMSVEQKRTKSYANKSNHNGLLYDKILWIQEKYFVSNLLCSHAHLMW